MQIKFIKKAIFNNNCIHPETCPVILSPGRVILITNTTVIRTNMHEVAYYNAYYTNSKKPGSLSILLIMEHKHQKNSTLRVTTVKAESCWTTLCLLRKLKNRKIIVFLEKYIYIHKYTHREKNHKGNCKSKKISYYRKVARLSVFFFLLFYFITWSSTKSQGAVQFSFLTCQD